jgi:hypothetical protein
MVQKGEVFDTGDMQSETMMNMVQEYEWSPPEIIFSVSYFQPIASYPRSARHRLTNDL